jgi:dTDP-4-amino-4,6-dideoxygalactose transaminase
MKEQTLKEISTIKVPLVDLQANYKPIQDEVREAVNSVMEKCNFILGKEVQDFEASFAKYCGVKYAIGVANGTDALHLAARVLGIGPGDEVLIPANTFIATALGVAYSGAKPVPVDIDPSTFLMDNSKIEKAITPRTKAIMPVHLFGRMVDMDPVLDIARRKNLVVIEDAAQGHGAELRGKRAGSVGAIGSFSFYPGKNLGCFGDGGALTTNDENLRAKLEALRNYGSPKKYHHPILGYNSRLDTMQAAILSVKLRRLDQYNHSRYQLAKRYNQALAPVREIILPQIPESGSHIFHLYVIRTKKRDALLAFLNERGIGAGIHYPSPIHLHGAFESLGYRKGSFPVAEQLCDEILSLPIYPELSDQQFDHVVSTVKDFFKG